MEQVGIDDNFFEVGGDSIKTVLISGRLQKSQFRVNVNEFFLNPTIRQLARHLKEKEPVIKKEVVSRDEEIIRKNINRDYEIYLEQVKKEKWPDLSVENDYKNIMLTGATGYLGAYLLYELLDKTSAALYLPVRGATKEEAKERLKKKVAFYFGDDFFYKNSKRIVIMKGDLTENLMGIDNKQYENLCENVDAVVHSAANVKHYGLYEELYKDNVEGTERLLEFALTKRKKDFHFISTLDTGRGDIPGKDYLLYTEYCHDEDQNSNHLYIKSKFEAEKRVLDYREKGLHASIYRAGNVTFHSESGRFQENIENNAFYAIMRGVIKVGFLSDNMRKMEFDMSFINYTARAIILLLTKERLKNDTYHIANPNRVPMKDMIEFLKQSGLKIPEVEEGKIEEHLDQFVGNSEYEKIIQRVKLDSWVWDEKPATLTVPKLDRTVMLLKKIGFEWPKITKSHIKKMIAYCKEVGFL
jgi:thioester reductase-like protein